MAFLVSVSLLAVLVFPAVSPRLRFLIHQVVESNFETLKTFSIGTIDRRTVICPKSIYMEKEKYFPLYFKTIIIKLNFLFYDCRALPLSNHQTLPQTTDTSPQPRKTKAANERAIYRPPPARSSGKPLQETTSNQNGDHCK